MLIRIDLKKAYDIQKNIDAIQRYIDGQQLSTDFSSLIDTKSILEGIKKEITQCSNKI